MDKTQQPFFRVVETGDEGYSLLQWGDAPKLYSVRLPTEIANRIAQPAKPPRDDVGELRECVRQLARAIHMEAVGLIDRAKFRAICVDVIDRLTAQSGPAGEVGDG